MISKENMEKMRQTIIERARKLLVKETSEGKKINKKTIAIALATAAAGLGVAIGFRPKPTDSKLGVVKYVFTNGYKTPERNVVDDFELNRLIIYKKEDIESWQQNPGRTIPFIKVGSVLGNIEYSDIGDEIIPENMNRTKSYPNENLYVLKENIDEYIECTPIDTLKFRLRPDFSEDSPRYANEGTLYVCLNAEGRGEHNFKKAMLIDDKGNITRGYVADEDGYITPNPESNTCIGVANDYTYLRSSAELTEFKEENIVNSVRNGQVLEIVDDSDKDYYECKFADSSKKDTFFVRKNTVISFDDFDCDAQYIGKGAGMIYGFANDGSVITRRNQDGMVANVIGSDILKVDYNSSNGSYYSVYDASNGVVGYMDGSLLRDSETGLTIAELCDPSIVHTRPATTPAEERTTQTNGTETNIQNPSYNGENQMTITLDAYSFNPEKLKACVEYYKKNNIKVGGIYFSIGSSYGGSNENINIAHISDAPSIYSEYISDRTMTSIQKSWNEISETSGINLQGSTGRGNAQALIDSIEYAISQNIPVGLFYYSAELDETEVSCVAAYCDSMCKYLNEYCEGYRNYDKKLPFGIDIECNSKTLREQPQNINRGKTILSLIELLGEGIKSDDPNKYFCIDGKSPNQGYGVISKDTGVVLYGDVRNNKNDILTLLNSGEITYDELVSRLQNNGYKVNLWSSSKLKEENTQVQFSDTTLKKLQSQSILMNSIQNTVSVSSPELQKLFEQSAIAQLILEKYLCGQDIDVSVTTDENIYNLLNGIPITKTFYEAIEETNSNRNLAEPSSQGEDDGDIDIG